ncbi:hypothetical protein SVIOM342S_02048 [Streptomyces violaceorubidus]
MRAGQSRISPVSKGRVNRAPPPRRSPLPATPRRKVSRHRGEGQWAAGHFTPLNGNEQTKKDDDGLNVRTRIETIYSKRGFDSIDPGDLRGRMRWWGLYTQRRQGIDGGKTAVLEPEELDDRYFMLRVRIDGGALTTAQLRVIGEISQEFARGTADITDRQNVQYHWIRIEDVPEIWNRLEGVGLSTVTACGDTPRVMIGSPVAGIAEDEIIDGTPALEEMKRRVLNNPAYSNLPRKFKTAISGSPVLDVVHEINDVAFVGVEHPEHGPGFDLWVGGGLSTNPKLGVRLNAWVPIDDVPDVYEGVISIFRDYGYRRLRNRARLKFLVADWGAEKFRQVLEDEYLKRKLTDGPAPAEPTSRWRDQHAAVRRREGRPLLRRAAPRACGRVDGALLTGVADPAEAPGSGRACAPTVEQEHDRPGRRGGAGRRRWSSPWKGTGPDRPALDVRGRGGGGRGQPASRSASWTPSSSPRRRGAFARGGGRAGAAGAPRTPASPDSILMLAWH